MNSEPATPDTSRLQSARRRSHSAADRPRAPRRQHRAGGKSRRQRIQSSPVGPHGWELPRLRRGGRVGGGQHSHPLPTGGWRSIRGLRSSHSTGNFFFPMRGTAAVRSGQPLVHRLCAAFHLRPQRSGRRGDSALPFPRIAVAGLNRSTKKRSGVSANTSTP